MGGENFKKFIFFTVAVTATFGISLAFQYAVAVWTAPLNNPPACASGDPGCDEPLNVSNTAQQKSGMLLLNYGNSATGLVVQYGSVGIGVADPVRKFHLADTNKTTVSNDSNALITSTDAPDADIGGSLGLGGRYDSNNNPIAFATVYGRKENAASNNVSGYLAFAVRDHSAAPYNFERMRVTSSGNVGIGTTNPQGDLVVAGGGASYFQGGVNMGVVWNGSSFTFKQLADASQNIVYGAANSGSGFGNLLKLERCSNGATPDCATQFTVSNVGHVSIGNIAPQANTVFYLSKTLSAQSGAAYAARVGASLIASANNDKLYGLDLSGSLFSNTDSYSGVNIYGLHIKGSTWGGTANGSVANAYAIYTDAPTKGANNWAIYSASGQNYFGGNVGIGTTTPAARLDLGQLTSSLEGLRIKIAASSGFSPLAIVKADDTDAFRVKQDGNVCIGADCRTSWPSSQWITGSGVFYGGIYYSNVAVMDDGNVGIGTTDPGARLQINPPSSVEGIRIVTASDNSPLNIRNNANTTDILRIDQNGDIRAGRTIYKDTSGNVIIQLGN